MRLASFAVIVAAILVLAAGMPASTTPAQSANASPKQPTSTPTKPLVQKVRIVVAESGVHLEQCKGGKYQPVDILVDANPMNNVPSHCVKGTVHSHANAHKYDVTIVKLSYKAKDSVLWYSDVPFQITSIAPHEDKKPGVAPKNPFEKPISDAPTKAIESGPIIQAAVTHRYKINLRINGRDIDPDLWCNP